jgi:hypothetical protein
VLVCLCVFACVAARVLRSRGERPCCVAVWRGRGAWV